MLLGPADPADQVGRCRLPPPCPAMRANPTRRAAGPSPLTPLPLRGDSGWLNTTTASAPGWRIVELSRPAQTATSSFETTVNNPVKRGDHAAVAAARQNPGQGGKTFRPTDIAIAMRNACR